MYLSKCDIEMLERVARNNPGDGSKLVHHYMQLVVDLGNWAEQTAGIPISEILRPAMPAIDPDHPHARAKDQQVAQMTLEPMNAQENAIMGALVDFRKTQFAEG